VPGSIYQSTLLFSFRQVPGVHIPKSQKKDPEEIALFAWLISHQPAVLFSQNKLATSNQPTVLFSQNKSAPAVSQQPNEQAEYLQAFRC
jgi:hypothetical protein